MMIAIPEPWSKNATLSQDVRDFYQYYATMMEPWDGPASIVFSDGDIMGAVLDRNGLRPSRYYVMKNGDLILASEVGVLDVPEEEVVLKERLHPGKMLLVDTVKGKIYQDEELKEMYTTKQPYGEWLDSNLTELSSLKIPNQKVPSYTPEECKRLQKAFGYSYEEVKTSILNMAKNGVEGTAAMGIDAPLAVLSDKHQNLFGYFKQLFAQVTNPPIDAIREEVVTSTTVYIGADGNLLEERAEKLQDAEGGESDSYQHGSSKDQEYEGRRIPDSGDSHYLLQEFQLEKAIDYLFIEVDRAIREGANILILSDRGVDEYHVAMPSLLALSGLQQHLVRTKKRTSVAIILETGEPREVHHFATLLATALVRSTLILPMSRSGS